MMTEQTGPHHNPNGAPLAASNGGQEARRLPAKLTGFRRRACLTNPGEPLLLARDPIESVIRFGQFAEQSGIDMTELVASHTVAVPLPIWAEPWPTGTRRWKGTREELMWHPLMWLPRHLASRTDLPSNGDRQLRQESDDEWSVRVALEMTVSGLYDQDTGTWLDVLATVDIDIDRPDARARVAAWLAGRDDAALDRIDLTNLMTVPEDPHWSSWAAVELAPVLRRYSWALGSDALIDVLDSLPSEIGQHGMDRDVAVGVATTVATVGSTWIDGVPNSDGAEALRRFAVELGDSSPSTVAALIEGPVARMSAALLEVRERFWPAMDSEIAELGRLAGGVDRLLEGRDS